MATLSVTHEESLILNGSQHGGTNIFTIDSITQVMKKIVTCPGGSDTTIATFGSTTHAGDGDLDIQSAKYVRVTNLDSTNSVNLSVQLDSGEDDSAADASATSLLAAGQSFVLGTPHESFHVDDDAASIVTALTDVESILIDPGANSVDLEIFVASATTA